MTARKAAAGPFRDLSEFMAEAEPIRLPIGGKVYEFPGAVSGRTGLLLTTALDATMAARQAAPDDDGKPVDPELVELLTDEQEASVHDELFAGVDRELVRDGHDSRVIRHVFLTLVTWHTAGEEAAVRAWESLAGKAEPNRAERRRRSGSSAAARTTRKPTSGSGTRATSRASASSGRTSSRAGR